MDRREALKRLAAASTVASGASAVFSSTAFADGGTASKRPTCSGLAGSYVTWASNNFNHVRFPVSSTVSCATGWTGSTQYQFSVTAPGSGVTFRNGNSTTELGATTASLTPSGTIRLTDTGSGNTGSLTAAATLTVGVVVRRVCTNTASPTRKAYCCVSFTKTGAWVRGSSADTWAGAQSGNFGAGTTPFGCTAP